MSFRQLVRKVVGYAINVCSTTNIPTSGSYVTLVAALPGAVSALIVSNGTTSTLLLGTGTAGNEVPFYAVGPGESGVLIPCEGNLPKGVRLSVLAADAAATTGTLAVNLLAG